VLREDRREVPAERHVAANKDPVLCAAGIYAQFLRAVETRSLFHSIFLRIILSPLRLRIIL